MLIGRIHGATRVLGKPESMTDEKCGSLAILDMVIDDQPVMVSAWHPTPAEVKRMAAGEPVYLWVYGQQHPVVAMTVAGEELA
ncbi:hypothetical protein GCM10027432_24320 [Lysobacter fragariae]